MKLKNITLLQENGKISIMLMVSNGGIDVNLKIHMIKKSVKLYYVYLQKIGYNRKINFIIFI